MVKQGKTYNSYKDLCKALGVKPKEHKKDRIKHLSQLASQYKITQRGRKYTIEEIYDEPPAQEGPPHITFPEPKNNGYMNYVNAAFVDYCLQSSLRPIYLSTPEFCVATGMANPEYPHRNKTIKDYFKKHPSENKKLVNEIITAIKNYYTQVRSRSFDVMIKNGYLTSISGLTFIGEKPPMWREEDIAHKLVPSYYTMVYEGENELYKLLLRQELEKIGYKHVFSRFKIFISDQFIYDLPEDISAIRHDVNNRMLNALRKSLFNKEFNNKPVGESLDTIINNLLNYFISIESD